MKKHGLTPVLAVLLLAILSGCASAPELAEYPRTEIDRPYVLPPKVATWSTLLPFGYFQDSTRASASISLPLPFFWTSSLSEKWNLHWSPVPTAVSYQIHQSDERLLGLTFGSGYGYGSTLGFVISPRASLFYREKLTPTIAAEFKLGADTTFYTGGTAARWQTELVMGPLFQVTPLLALRAVAKLRVSNGSSELYLSPTIGTVVPSYTTTFTVPLALGAVWSADRQWDVSLHYQYHGIGEAGGYSAHLGSLIAVHYW